jgi:transposase-like protein
MCPLCARPRQVLGRKRQRVQGLSTWVCHECKTNKAGPK